MRAEKAKRQIVFLRICGECGLRARKVHCFLNLSLKKRIDLGIRARTSRNLRTSPEWTICLKSEGQAQRTAARRTALLSDRIVHARISEMVRW